VSGGQQLLHSRFFDPKRYDLGRVGRYKINKKLRLTIPDAVRTLTAEDVLSTIDYLINLELDVGGACLDDIDHLGNRRVRSVGELLQNQVRVGLNRLERIIKERMTVGETESLTPPQQVNPKPQVAAVKDRLAGETATSLAMLLATATVTGARGRLARRTRMAAVEPASDTTRPVSGLATRRSESLSGCSQLVTMARAST
jgi:DNA-directed RNA polymerase subunit beta